MVIPLFFGSVFGPWVGLGTAGVGSFVGHSLVGNISTAWYIPESVALLGFVAGLTLLTSQGRYDNRRNIMFATGVSCLELIVYSILTLFEGYLFNHFSINIPYYLGDTFIMGVTVIILLPILLIIYNAVVKHRSHP